MENRTLGFGAYPRGPSEVTLAGGPLTARPPKPGDVTDEGAPLICALLLGTRNIERAKRLRNRARCRIDE